MPFNFSIINHQDIDLIDKFLDILSGQSAKHIQDILVDCVDAPSQPVRFGWFAEIPQ
jgi:hypothetical protein